MSKRLTGWQLLSVFAVIVIVMFVLVVAITADDERDVPTQNNSMGR
jgi:hypothetical protein